jgi:hypothetical protein
MKIKINKEGNLEIDRKGQWKQQNCPFAEAGEAYCADPCGGWCPLFEEPVITGYCFQLALCRKTYKGLIENFTDERP